MSSASPPTHHSIYLSGNFKIEKKISPITPASGDPEYTTFVVSIGCRGTDRDARLLYEIRATGLSTDEHKLFQDHTYFLRGSFFPTNLPGTENDQLVFEGTDATMVASIDNFEADSVDTIGISGLGIVVDIGYIVERCCQYLKKTGQDADLQTAVVTLQHCKVNPIDKSTHMCKVEYLIRPTPNLARIATFLKNGRECMIHGFIKDYNVQTNSYVVVANKLYMTSGFQDVSPQAKGKLVTNGGASKKPSKFVSRPVSSPFVSPIPGSIGSGNIASGSSHLPRSVANSGTPSSPALSLPSTSTSFPDSVRVSDEPPKKRSRAPPRSKAYDSCSLSKRHACDLAITCSSLSMSYGFRDVHHANLL
ncbi:uncharacterized protein MELLADRAFT_60781 [Melampsora larici-populina 98AG31]|uniref:Uncharacterized protein n=1 Tax=Melampsora larici-populina (strain 98AG31 / pathotype 3-4-7) TaxID=747676 RepID=F4RC91_MELLP|nr:uncharacterized protein MELLADRAFT_60781 [Melampsora larici-populina 98AG31]EGG09698.1 hypothetical protein MELLADRAFT_60781 [Melampsora larici-populina 98AG31]